MIEIKLCQAANPKHQGLSQYNLVLDTADESCIHCAKQKMIDIKFGLKGTSMLTNFRMRPKERSCFITC